MIDTFGDEPDLGQLGLRGRPGRNSAYACHPADLLKATAQAKPTTCPLWATFSRCSVQIAHLRLAANLDVDDVTRRSPSSGIAVGDGEDALILVASPQAD